MSDTQETISKPGYSKQRLKLAPEAIMALCDFHNEGLYREEDMRTLNGYLVLASDGSGINVPTTRETLEKYGASSRKGTKPQASIGFSCLYDILNKLILCCSVNRVKFDEAAQAKAHLERVKSIIGNRKTIITLDRGYPSLPLFFRWSGQNQKFVVRLKGSDFKAERKHMGSDDEWVDITFDKTRLAHYKGTEIHDLLERAGAICLRIVNFKLDGGAVVSVATNLDESEFSVDDVARVYALRWGIETAFDVLKNNLEIENFTGSLSVLIEQDIYASVYLCNVLQDMIADAQIAYDSSGKPKGKHTMAINKSYAVGIMKDNLVKALLESDLEKKTEIFTQMLADIQKNVLPIRPDRHFARTKGVLAGKYSNSRKRCY